MSRKPHVQIVKPPTAKQRAANKRYADSYPVVLVPQTSGLPRASWWCGVTREELAAKVREQSERMKQSKFGRTNEPLL